MPACQQNQSKMCSCTSTSRDSSVPRSPAFDVDRSEFNTRTSSDADARPVIEAPKMKRFSFKFLVLALCAFNVASAHASGLQPLPSDTQAAFLKQLRAKSDNSHSRKLLAGAACLPHALSPNAQAFTGTCGALTKKDEGHWCDMSELGDVVEYFTDYDADDVDALASVIPSVCIADSEDDCCPVNGGVVAGVVIGCVAGLVGIITLFAFLCKCCCFRPKLVVQAQPQQAPQVVVVKS